MILARYAPAVAAIARDRGADQSIRVYFSLPNERPLLYAMRRSRYGQADLLLALLAHSLAGPRSWEYAEWLLGKPIQVFQPVRVVYPTNGPGRARRPRITSVAANPRLPGTDAHHRYASSFKTGRTLEEAMARGATTRDVRGARRRGWIEVEA